MKYPYLIIGFALLTSCTENKNSKFNVVQHDSYESNFKTKAVFELHAKGRKELEDGHFEKAKELFTNALKDDAQNKILLNDLGITEAQLGNYENSIEDLKKALSLDSTYFEGYINLSLSLTHKGDFHQAIKTADHVIKSTQETKILCGAYENKAYAEFKLNDYDLALKDIDRAIKLCEGKAYPENLKKDIVQAKNKEELKERFK
jgi:tetratricopeptide (TPR) repeat protein